jgi:hypothetical protein
VSAVNLLPWPIHEGVEYLAGVFFVIASFFFRGGDNAVVFPLFVAVGVVVLMVAVLSRGPAGIAQVLPTQVHGALDYVLAFFLLIAPFIFGFQSETAPLYVSMGVGLAHLVISLISSFPSEARPADQPQTRPQA